MLSIVSLDALISPKSFALSLFDKFSISRSDFITFLFLGLDNPNLNGLFFLFLTFFTSEISAMSVKNESHQCKQT